MQQTTENTSSPDNASRHHQGKLRHAAKHLAWLRSPIYGYAASFFLVGGLLFIEKIDEQVPQVSLFIGTPFALVSILVALIWGVGPALVALVLGLIIVFNFVSPGTLTADFIKDIAIIGPFILLQFVAIATVIRLERSRRALLVAHRELEITHRKLVESSQQLERANVLKDYVMTRAAHELRTPLTTILGRTQLISARLDKSGETPENWRTVQKYIEVVNVRALHLRSLIESLFDLSSISSGNISLQRAPCDLTNLCCEVVEDQRVLSDRPIELERPAGSIVLQADEKLLCEVLENLLNNALKYSPEHTPISVRLYTEDEHAILQVHNEGYALSSEQLERLFDPFYRTPDREYSPIQGWGLGLTISKEIVERHGGQIWAESPDRDSVIVFVRLPLY
jgi:signal transduction histidine kinase